MINVPKPLPQSVAADILRTRYPDAALAFVGGSFNRGEETAFSDIDLVVIFETLEHAWRESFTHDGWPVEAFVHDPQTLRWFFRHDAEQGTPILATMVAEGPIVPEGHPLGAELKALAYESLRQPPPEWDSQKLAEKRYAITNLIDDLRDPRSMIETAATLSALHEELGNFYFRARRLWSASAKHIPRKLAKADPQLAERWDRVFIAAWQSGKCAEVIALAEDILLPQGGFLFDGHRLDAPKEWR